jgi:hypothetical protein
VREQAGVGVSELLAHLQLTASDEQNQSIAGAAFRS